jgi:hypothetical protein
MFCSKCGAQLPDDANFCNKCGNSMAGASTAPKESWEHCEIQYVTKHSLLLTLKARFYAEAIGPKGTYCAASSDVWLNHTLLFAAHHRPTSEAYEGVVQALVQSGWEPVAEKGSAWFNKRFRRRASFTGHAGA